MKSSIIFVVSGPEGYGIRNVWASLFRILMHNGYEVVIAVLDNQYVKNWQQEFERADVICSRNNWQALPARSDSLGRYSQIFRRGISQLQLSGWLKSIVKQRSAKALFFQVPTDALICGVVARRCGIPALWFVPNAVSSGRLFDLNKRIYRSLFYFGNVVPVSNSRYTDSTFGPGNFRRYVAHLGVDAEAFYPVDPDDKIRESYKIPSEAKVIGLFARMTPSKGQLHLIEASAKLPHDIHILLCGGPLEGVYYQKIIAKVSALGLSDRVHFAGFQSDLRHYYAACDVIANLRCDPEPFGLTVIEAMACAKPVIAHSAGGPSETIVDGETGWLISEYSESEILDGLHRVVSDCGRWTEFGDAGRLRVENEFSLVCFETRVLNVVRKELS